MVCFAESLEVYDLPRAEEPDDIIYVRVVTETEDIVIGDAGLLLCCQILCQVSDGIAGGLHCGGAPGGAGCGNGVHAGSVVHKVGIKTGSFDLLVAEVPGQLMDNGAHHLQMPQLLRAYKGVEMYHFGIRKI